MLIDWFTVGAQALNFLVLVWLMKRFLYKPILDAIDAREKMIASEIANADARKGEAAKEHDEFSKKNEDFDRERAGLMTAAEADVKSKREELLGEAQKAADDLRAKDAGLLETEMAAMKGALIVRTKQEVFALARKALADLASTSLEDRIEEVFVRRLKELDGPSKNAFGVAVTATGRPARLLSSFELPSDRRAAIQKALNETFSTDVSVEFETSEVLICGIELIASGRKLSWNIGDYLDAVEESAAQAA